MEDQQVEVSKIENNTLNNTGAQPLQSYTGKAPWPLLLVAGFMLLSGIGNILHGISRLSFFGLGLIPIIIGGLLIWFALAIYKMQKKGYVGGLILMGLGAVSNLYQLIMPGGRLLWELACVAITLLPIGVLYYYRSKIVH